MSHLDSIAALRIGLASPQDILHWSHGEVARAETINFRTQKPVKDGLFCEAIFGPTRDWSCACGKYQKKRRPGFRCTTCGVELAPATVRRERMGHIALAAPIAHPWHLRTIALLLDLSPRHLASVLAYQSYLVLQIDEAERRAAHHRASEEQSEQEQEASLHLLTLRAGDLLEEEHYHTLSLCFPATFEAMTGAEALRHLLCTLDLDTLATQLHDEVTTQGNGDKKAMRRLETVNAFRTSGQRPDWMILSLLPVLPPELRPLLVLEGDRIASSDLNELYCRILHRNHRLKRLIEQGAPELLLNQERRLLQQACSALLDNAHQKKKVTDARGRPLKSLTDVLQGKQGRFRRNLLGKRVDYSGRSVIVPGPQLKLHECGLPKEMARELFKPFLIGKLLDHHYAPSPKIAKRMIERGDEIIWQVLEAVLFERVVLLNRAPTLHRLSIQAFQPRLIEGQAMQLHPLVCSAFNADFDGDQMAVHVPLSQQAQEEARRLLLSTHNLRHPASGEPALSPSQEIVLGCFYLTEERPGTKKAGRIFTNRDEALLAHAAGVLDLHTPIIVRTGDTAVYLAPPPTLPEPPTRGRVKTTLGRLLFNDRLPQPLRYRNYPMNKEALKALVSECLLTCGQKATVQLLDAIKALGYHAATRSGISFAMSDIPIPPERATLIAQGSRQTAAVEHSYQAGEMTMQERHQHVITIWTRVTEEISATLEAALDPFGTIMTIVKSGATKAKFQQIRQLSGIRGLLASPSGIILPIPVLSNYRLGLLVWEIFIAASAARKGFMDRSLNTAISGYLTRRLVEAGMEVIITQEDCQTREGLLLLKDASGLAGLPLTRSSLLGRVMAEDVGTLAAGTLLDDRLVDVVLASDRASLRVRSPLCCQASYGVCRYCYGSDLATGMLIQRGAAVGILAGQAIGEPGTQLTMRTFHAGGIANNAADITLGLPRVNELFEVRSPAQAAPMAEEEGIVQRIKTDGHTGAYQIHIASIQHQESEGRAYRIPLGRTPSVRGGQQVEIGTPLAEGPLHPAELLRLVGQERTGHYLIQEIQKVYRGTGALIHDKHLEVMLRQMLRSVQVVDSGDTELLPGSLLDRFAFQQSVAPVLAQGGRPARAQPQLLGLTATALQTTSWIAAASFQDMSRVLSQAAIRGQQDPLIGLKEHLVIGKKLSGMG